MLQFELTAEDYVAGNFLHASWTRARWLRALLMAAAFAAFVLWRMPHEPERAFLSVAGYLAGLALLLIVYRHVFVPWRARRVFAQTKALQRPYSWSWDDDQLRYKTDLATGIVPWSNLSSWRENETVFALYASSVAFFSFPKRSFSDEAAVDAFRAALRTKIAASAPEAAF